jgi:hypothetical protein
VIEIEDGLIQRDAAISAEQRAAAMAAYEKAHRKGRGQAQARKRRRNKMTEPTRECWRDTPLVC